MLKYIDMRVFISSLSGLLVGAAAVALTACHSKSITNLFTSGEPDDLIYSCESFTVTRDSVNVGGNLVSLDIIGRNDSTDSAAVSLDGSFPVLNKLFNRAVAIVNADTLPDDNRLAHTSWLAQAYLNPQLTMKQLRRRVGKDGLIISEPSAMPWPVTSDRPVWILAGVDAARAAGRADWADEIVKTGRATIINDHKLLVDTTTGLIYGAQSYLLPQPMLYPEWMTQADIYQSPTLGSNVMMAAAARRLLKLDKLTKFDGIPVKKIADSINSAIHANLWQPNLHYFSSYLYCYPYTLQPQTTDNMAQAAGVVYGVFDKTTSIDIVASTPVFDNGVPVLYPVPPSYRHSVDRAMQPLVQSFWTLAAFKVKNSAAALLGTASLINTSLNDSTSINLTAPGIISLVCRGIYGMDFGDEGLSFSPVLPQAFGSSMKISRFPYRKATLDIEIKGHGDSIIGFSIDGKPMSRFIAPDTLTGHHKIEISLKQTHFINVSRVVKSKPVTMPVTPVVQWTNSRYAFFTNRYTGIEYELYVNGEFQTMFSLDRYRLFNSPGTNVINFVPVDNSVWEGFSPRPYFDVKPGDTRHVKVKATPDSALLQLDNLTAGRYLVTLIYEGNSKPAIASMSATSAHAGSNIVFPATTDKSASSSSIVIPIGLDRSFTINPVDGKLPSIRRAVLTRL